MDDEPANSRFFSAIKKELKQQRDMINEELKKHIQDAPIISELEESPTNKSFVVFDCLKELDIKFSPNMISPPMQDPMEKKE